jgi:hypothetical protein
MKNRSKNLFFVIVALFVFTNCVKKKKNIPDDINCDNAQVCVGNLTNDTIFYEWNSNGLGDTLLPGKSTCLNVGPVRCIYNRNTGDIKDQLYSTVSINSTWGTWAINVETCLKKSNFEYNNSNPSSGVI